MGGMTFGQWFRQERKARGWQQAWVARRVGVSRSQMNNIEAGRSRAGDETLQALYALFETTPGDVYAALKAAEASEPVDHAGFDALAEDAGMCREFGITRRKIEKARAYSGSGPVRTKEGAVRAV